MASEIEMIAAKLAEPFSAADIEWRIGATNDKENPTKGIALAYITNRAVQQRLDDVVGVANWRNEFQMWKANATLCGISIRFGGEWVTKWDGADDSEMEAIKGGLSDAMKRAAYQWGIGRYLYNLDSIWVPVEKRGRTTVMKGNPPTLPDWALPEADRRKSQNATPPSNEESSIPPAPPKQLPPLPSKVITDSQRKRLFALAHEHGWSDDELKALLKKKGYDSSKAILATDYESICNDLLAKGLGTEGAK